MKFNFDKTLALLKESITFSIADAERPVTNILDLSFALRKDLVIFMQQNFAPEEWEYFNKNVVGYEFITPDGDDYDEKEGLMNFYTKGIPDRWIVKCVSFLNWKIKEDHGEVLNTEANLSRLYQNTLTYRFKVKIDVPDDVAPEVNYSNVNALAMLRVLGYGDGGDDDYAGTISINEMLMKIGQIEDNDIHLKGHVRPEESGKNHIFFGLDLEDIKRRLGRLKELCEWGLEHNYSHITYS